MEDMTRREALKTLGAVAGGAAVLGVACLRAGADDSPAPAPAPVTWIDAGPLPKLAVGDVQSIALPDPNGTVYLHRTSDKDYVALCATCTHHHCTVIYDAPTTDFHCPCHGAQYDETGKVLKGPAQLPLYALQTKIDDKNELWVSTPPILPRHRPAAPPQ